MKQVDYKKYFDLFKFHSEMKKRKEQIYIDTNNIDIYKNGINNIEHPDYFKIDEEWEEKRKELDKPILDNAYYKIGDIVQFVKKNTYSNNENRPHLLLDKKLKSIVIDLEHECNYEANVYYENVIVTGEIKKVKTSDSGSGEIIYLFDNLIPPCPESNPYCLEGDIINLNNKYWIL